MRLIHYWGDILASDPSFPIVQAVSQDVRTNRGLAKYLEQRFRMRKELLRRPRAWPSVEPIYRYGRLILNVITKHNARDKPTPYMVFASLKVLREYTRMYKIRRLAIPEFSCGLDGLSYNTLIDFLYYLFQDDNIEIVMYHLN